MKHADWLPDCYRKDPSSNNNKLLSLNEAATRELCEDIKEIWDALDLSQATGKSLDLYGATLSWPRGPMTDEQYRYMLFAQIGKNHVGGDYPSIVNALMMMFGEQWEAAAGVDFELIEDDKPCLVRLAKYPEVLEEAGFTIRQIAQMVKGMLPIGITLLLQFYSWYEIPILYDNAICVRTEFHPRYNLPYLHLDGSWKLDGGCRMNGYASDRTLNFYPAYVHIRIGTAQKLWVEPQLRVPTAAGFETEMGITFCVIQGVVQRIWTGERMHVWTEAGTAVVAETAERARMQAETAAEVKTVERLQMQAKALAEVETEERARIRADTGIEASAKSAVCIVQEAMQGLDTEEAVRIQAKTVGSVWAEERLQIPAGAGCQIETASFMTKMNQMNAAWKLDGSRKLDGGRYIL